MRHHPVTLVLLAAGLLVAMWSASLAVYDGRKTGDALRWRQAERDGVTPFRWPFDAPAELAHGHGLQRIRWADGTARGELNDPYFYLNLQGRYIDARRFDRIALRLHAAESGFLQLFHGQGRADRIHVSPRIPLRPGWQTVELYLPGLGWEVKDLVRPDVPDQPSGWGNEEGVVTGLRIDPVESGAFAVDWLELQASGPPRPLSDRIERFGGLDDPLFERMRADPGRVWVIAQDRLLRTPESAHWTRRQVAEAFPSAILFPRAPAVDELDAPATAAASPWRLPAAIYVLGVLGLVLSRRLDSPWRPLLEVAVLLALIEGCIYLAPLAGGAARLALAVPLAIAIWALRPKPLAPRVLGGERAWLLVSPLLLLAVLVLWLAPTPLSAEGPNGLSLPRALGIYFLWSLAQQFIVAELFMGRLWPILGRAGMLVSAGLFGFLHFPNFALMAATFALGLVLLPIHRRYHNLPAIAAAQAFLSVAFNSLALEYFWLSREIGPAFLARL